VLLIAGYSYLVVININGEYNMNALKHYIVEVIITIIKLIKGYGLESFDCITYKQYKENKDD